VGRPSAWGSGLNVSRASTTSAAAASLPSLRTTDSRCPSSTGTRAQLATMSKAAGSTLPPLYVPSILWISSSIFSSSFRMKGTTFPRMSRDGTPG